MRPRLLFPVSLILILLPIGCGSLVVPIPVGPVDPPNPLPVTGTYPGHAFGGRVLAGNQPLIGANVELYAAGTSGNGVLARSLLTSSVLTDDTGLFAVSASYSCPLPTTQLYLVARSGGVGSSSVLSNSEVALTTALGSCNQVASESQFTINEVTTVATAWALAQFAGYVPDIGSSSTNTLGLANAFQIAASLASPVTGRSPGTTLSPNVTLPVARINTLANLLNTCTASKAQDSSGSSCDLLFSAGAGRGSIAPANTFDAALNIVRNPDLNVDLLFGLSLASKSFTPTLLTAPSDWTLWLTISGGGMNGPATVGVLSNGSIWVSNYFDVASAFTPTGTPVFVDGVRGFGLDHSYGLAVDASDNAWIGNEDNGTITELANSGSSLSGNTGYAGGGINYPVAIAIDPDTSVWVADYGNAHITRLSSSGLPLSGASGFSSTQIAFPVALAIDSGHNAWVANSEGNTITRLSRDGGTVASATCCDGPTGVAIDQRGYVWISNFYGDSVSEISQDLKVVSNGFTAPALSRPQGIAVDGTGNVWVASFRASGIVELAGSQTASPGSLLSPTLGWAHDAAMLEPYSLAIDSSGNIWVANFGNATLSQIVGLAAPVATPAIGPVHTP